MDIITQIAEELTVKPSQVQATIDLIDAGATVPFIARYRKEVTGGLTDTQLRLLETRLGYLRELEERRTAILKSIDEQGKLTPELSAAILAADNKARLEDLYLPYKPKRRTKAQIAKEAGLEPLAMGLLADPMLDPQVEATKYVDADKQLPDVKAVLEGARHILMEMMAEDAELIGKLRLFMQENIQLKSQAQEEKPQADSKFSDYFAYSEPLHKVPSHRALAILRGQRENVLTVRLGFADEAQTEQCIGWIANSFQVSQQGRPADGWLYETVAWTWKIKLLLKLEAELLTDLRGRAELDAIKVFAVNLKDLLMASPAGPKVTMGLDPGYRTGVKVAIVDKTGKLVHHSVVMPHQPQNQWQKSLDHLAKLCKHFQVELISIGNGTASRETDKLGQELIAKLPELKMTKIVVSEAGASVYSASELASLEFPDIDVSYRGAVSIARRLQDPLAELVKIDPKAIGVGQYQHDVNQHQLAKQLDAIVEDCVNAVGVDVNMASTALLARVSGLNTALAQNIVIYRNQYGAFADRQTLRKVTRFGEKAFEQAAGFLRIQNGTQPLDASAVHPEAYTVVEKISHTASLPVAQLIGNQDFLKTLKLTEFTDDKFGLPTVMDIVRELEKPGRDPRPEFKMAQFKEGVDTLNDLLPGMVLEGVVTNMTDFGAFVDIGVHQDGLVHKSAMANTYVKDPRSLLHVGKIIKVKVVEIDLARKRISLTMNLEDKTVVKEKVAVKTHKPKMASKPVQQPSALATALLSALGDRGK